MTEPLSQIDLNDTFKIGVDSIDQEHAFLVGLYNDLARRIESDDTPGALMETAVQKLFGYADYHFASEERVMRLTGFPELDHHRRQHESFIRSLNDLVADRGAGDRAALRAIAAFVGQWIRGHILVTDKLFGEYVVASAPAVRPSAG